MELINSTEKTKHREKFLLFIGIILVVVGIVVNPWTVGMFLHVVPKPVTRLGNLILIYTFEIVTIVVGISLVVFRKRLDRAIFQRVIEKIWSVYKFAAVNFLSALVLFIILNIFIYIYAALRLQFSAAGANPIVKQYGETAVLEVYRGFKKTEIDQILEESRHRPLVFEPFTLFKEQPYRGTFVTISESGFRHVKNQAPWPLDRHNLNIFVFGGSTAFGYGVRDEDTIPSHLQEYLSQIEPRRQVAVYNFGRGYYFSTNERNLFENMLTKGFVPSVVVFIDGLNDLNLVDGNDGPPFIINALSNALDQNRSERASISAIVNRIPLVKFLAPLFVTTPSSPSSKQELDEGSLHKIAKERIARYAANQQIIEAAAKSFSVIPIFVWQPTPFSQYDLAYHTFGENIKSNHTSQTVHAAGHDEIQKLKLENKLGKNFLDLSYLQKEKTKPLYVDAVHYTSEFSKEVAGHIAQAIKQAIQR